MTQSLTFQGDDSNTLAGAQTLSLGGPYPTLAGANAQVPSVVLNPNTEGIPLKVFVIGTIAGLSSSTADVQILMNGLPVVDSGTISSNGNFSFAFDVVWYYQSQAAQNPSSIYIIISGSMFVNNAAEAIAYAGNSGLSDLFFTVQYSGTGAGTITLEVMNIVELSS